MHQPDIVAIICSTGRPQVLHETLIAIQNLSPGLSCVLVSVAAEPDVLPESRALPRVRTMLAPRGAAAQRNAALRSLTSQPDIIVFFDDDIEPAINHLAAYAACFRSDPRIVLATAIDVTPGIRNISRPHAQSLIHRGGAPTANDPVYRDCYTAYGASMALRGKLAGKVWFDENLPLYSFMEDFDFTLSCRALGRCVTVRSAEYVHLETSGGRGSALRRGYSEIVNPVYIARKHGGLMRRPRLFAGCLRRTARAHLRSVRWWEQVPRTCQSMERRSVRQRGPSQYSANALTACSNYAPLQAVARRPWVSWLTPLASTTAIADFVRLTIRNAPQGQ